MNERQAVPAGVQAEIEEPARREVSEARAPLPPSAEESTFAPVARAHVVRAADAMIDALVMRERVDVFFGLPGGAISPLHDALYRRGDVRVVTTRHEADAVFAAAGYAQATGKIGVALVTSGPGLLNAINALASAHLEGLPVLVLAGEAPRARFGQGALQEGSAYGLDLVHMVRPITKVAVELQGAGSAIPQLLSVIATMKRGRPGCALITCPVDVAQQPASPIQIGVASEEPPIIDECALDRAAELLAAAKRPVIYVGNGLRRGDGPAALRALAERAQIPVITNPHGKGVFPESHPLALGVFGVAAHPSAVRYLREGVDCVLAVGTGLGELASNSWSPLLQSRAGFIQIDVEAERIGRSYRVDVAIVGPAAPALRSIANRILQRKPAFFGVERNHDPAAFTKGPEGRISPARALWELQRALPRSASYVSDIGEHFLFATHYLQIDDPTAFSVQLGLSSMGSGMGTSIGIAAKRDRPVALITGDGCFSMQLGALATAAQERLPLVFCVLNDHRLAMCEIGHESVYGRKPDYGIPFDACKIAEGLGVRALRVDHPGEILALAPLDLITHGPLLIDVQIDRGVRMPQAARNEVLGDRSATIN